MSLDLKLVWEEIIFLTGKVRPVLEAIGAFAAVSFLLSVVIQMIMFGLWSLDFTAIASLDDAILGGVRVGVQLIVLSITTPLTLLVPLAHYKKSHLPNTRALNGSKYIVICVALFGLMIGIFILLYKSWLQDETLLTFSGPIAAATLVVTAHFPVRKGLLAAAAAEYRSKKGRVIVITLVVALGLVSLTYYFGYRNLILVNEQEAIPPCASEKGSRRVRWVGSHAAVVDCGKRRFVVMDSEHRLIFEVGYPPTHLLLQKVGGMFSEPKETAQKPARATPAIASPIAPSTNNCHPRPRAATLRPLTKTCMQSFIRPEIPRRAPPH